MNASSNEGDGGQPADKVLTNQEAHAEMFSCGDPKKCKVCRAFFLENFGIGKSTKRAVL